MANVLSQTEIAALTEAISRGEVPPAAKRPDGSRARVTRPKNAKSYDFSHPAVLLKDQMRALQVIHEGFARTASYVLSSYLRLPLQAKCLNVEQSLYGEFIQTVPDGATVVRLGLQPLEGQALAAMHPTLTSGILDRMAGGTGAPDVIGRSWSDADRAILEELLLLATRELATAWKRNLQIAFALEGIEQSTEFMAVARKEESVAAITLEFSFGQTQGILALCYPLHCLEALKAKLRPAPSAAKEPKDAALRRATMTRALARVPVRICARLGRASVTAQQLLQLKRGDVLVLDRAPGEFVDLEVGGKPRFNGHLGSHHGKIAVLIEHRLE